MLVLWQILLASFKSYLMEVKKKEKLRKLNSSSGQFLKSVAKYECSCRDMNIIRAFYGGMGRKIEEC